MPTMVVKPPASEALVTVRQGKAGSSITDPELSSTLRRAFSLWQRLKALEAELSEAREKISRRADELSQSGSSVSFEAGGIACTVTSRHEALVPEENLGELRKLLGSRFRDLVRTNTRHLATRRLVSEAGEDVLGLLSLRRLSPQFRWSVTDPCHPDINACNLSGNGGIK